MIEGGIPEATIINAISAENTQFDISASALIELQKHDVGPKIMSAMLAAARDQNPSTTSSSPAESPTNQYPPAPTSDSSDQSASTVVMTSGSTEDLLGAWQGVYFVYPQVVRIDLVLRGSKASEDSLEGTLHFQTLASDPRSITGTFQGGYALRGQYDPTTGSVVLLPGQWIQRPSQLASSEKMTGAFDRRTGMLAGSFSAPNQIQPNDTVSYFVLARPDKAPSALFSPMKHIWEEAQPTRPHPHFGGIQIGGQLGRPWGSGGEDINKIAKWAERLTREYPNINLQNTYANVPVQNLFEDRYFASNFGKTYDQLSEGERYKFAMGLRVYAGERDNEKMELRRKYYFLERYFEGFNVPGVYLGVLAQRVLRSWRDGTLAKLQSLSSEHPQKNFSAVEAMDKVSQQDLVYLWPSERANITKEMNAARSRFAGPALNASAREITRSADGYDGAVALSSWASQEQALLKWADDTEKTQDLNLVNSRLNGLLTPIMSAELKEFQSFGEGLDAILKGRGWLVNFNNRYSRFSSLAPVISTLKRAKLIRAQELEKLQGTLAREIDSQKSVASLDAVTSKYLLQDDSQSTEGRALWAHVAERRQTLEKVDAARETLESKAAALGVSVACLDHLNSGACLGPHEKDETGGPDVGQIYDAIERRIEGYNEGLKTTIAKCKNGDFRNDPTLPMACVGLLMATANNHYDLTTSITRLKKIGQCVSLAPTGHPGYTCAYIIGITQNNPVMTGWLGAYIRSGQLTEARFLDSGQGWLLMPSNN